MPNRIRELRERRGWNLDQLGVRLGMSGMSVSRLERGETRLKFDDLPRIADALGVEWHEIISQEPSLSPDEAALIEEYRHLPDDRKPNARPAIKALNPQPPAPDSQAAD